MIKILTLRALAGQIVGCGVPGPLFLDEGFIFASKARESGTPAESSVARPFVIYKQ
jgi:hypothetical protein